MDLKYLIDEKKLMMSEIQKSNPNMQRHDIQELLDTEIKNSEYQNVTIEISINNRVWTHKFINNLTQEIFYSPDTLNISIRHMFNRLFSKLYWKY